MGQRQGCRHNSQLQLRDCCQQRVQPVYCWVLCMTQGPDLRSMHILCQEILAANVDTTNIARQLSTAAAVLMNALNSALKCSSEVNAWQEEVGMLP